MKNKQTSLGFLLTRIMNIFDNKVKIEGCVYIWMSKYGLYDEHCSVKTINSDLKLCEALKENLHNFFVIPITFDSCIVQCRNTHQLHIWTWEAQSYSQHAINTINSFHCNINDYYSQGTVTWNKSYSKYRQTKSKLLIIHLETY